MAERKLITGNGNHTLIDKNDYSLTETGNAIALPNKIHICNQHASVKNEISLYTNDGANSYYYFHKLILPNGTALEFDMDIGFSLYTDSLYLTTQDNDSGSSTAITVLFG